MAWRRGRSAKTATQQVLVQRCRLYESGYAPSPRRAEGSAPLVPCHGLGCNGGRPHRFADCLAAGRAAAATADRWMQRANATATAALTRSPSASALTRHEFPSWVVLGCASTMEAHSQPHLASSRAAGRSLSPPELTVPNVLLQPPEILGLRFGHQYQPCRRSRTGPCSSFAPHAWRGTPATCVVVWTCPSMQRLDLLK